MTGVSAITMPSTSTASAPDPRRRSGRDRFVAAVAAVAAVAGLVGAGTVASTAGIAGAAPPRAGRSTAPRVVTPAQVTDAGEPSISTDGRWVVFGGTIDGRKSVFRTDRHTDQTIELSPVPVGVRSGDTIHPQISADGCVVAAITEIPFDLFRDNDRDDRFDVYRLVVPECGGQDNGWALVSGIDRTGIARDDVFTDDAPTLSGAGALVAYVHQAPGAPDGVATISVVDVTVPIAERGRVQTVAGMPIESPSGAFLYRGARSPQLSQNGRHLAFVSDTTASEALPGWGEGPVLGDFATSQVYVWDRAASDQRRAVRLISGKGGVPSAGGGDEPAISEDGRIIAFTSRDRTLVPANLTNCTPDCPSQVYRFDRDTDRNGIFDEPARRPELALVSAVDAGVVPIGLPEAGDQPSWSPALNADGTQIAFVTDATNLLPSRRGGGGGVLDGDLLVAEFALGQIRRVLDGNDSTGAPGAHGNPVLSRTGQVIAFDTVAADAIGAVSTRFGTGRSVMTVEAVPQLSLAALDFGTVLLGFESAELYATVLNAGPAAFEPVSVRSSSGNFKVTGGTCIAGIIVAAGNSCEVKLTFNPTAPRGFVGELTVTGNGAGSPSVTTTLRGAAGEPALLANPGGIDLADGVVGVPADRRAIDISNIGFVPVSVARVTIGGANPDDFHILSQACTRRFLNPDASCAVEVEFVPTDAGYRTALLYATTAEGAYTSVVLGGFARYAPELTAEETARPGEEFVAGGSGFPANSTLTIGFDDGGAPFAEVETGGDGGFIAILMMPARVRIGPRVLVASGPDGTVSNWTIDIQSRADRTQPVTPGYGLG